MDVPSLVKDCLCADEPSGSSSGSSWKKWPGAISGPSSHLEEGRWVPRPELFFRAESGMPGAVLLELTLPAAIEAWYTPEELAKLLELRVKNRQKKLLEEHAEKGRKLAPTVGPGGRAGLGRSPSAILKVNW